MSLNRKYYVSETCIKIKQIITYKTALFCKNELRTQGSSKTNNANYWLKNHNIEYYTYKKELLAYNILNGNNC